MAALEDTVFGNPELDDFSGLVGLVYDGPMEEVPWEGALNELRERLECNYVTLIVRPSTPDDPGLMVNAGPVSTEIVQSYSQHFYSLDPLVGLPDHMVTVEEIIGKGRWLETPFYQQFSRPANVFHVMGADIRTPDGAVCRFRLCRPPEVDAFSASDKAFCDRLLPHLRRAVTLHSQMDRMQSMGRLYAETVDRLMVGTVVLDEHGRLLQANRMAEDLLAEEDGLKVVNNKLVASFGGDNDTLQKLVREALSEHVEPDPGIVEAMSVMRPSGRPGIGVVVRAVPLSEWSEGSRRPAAAIFLRDPQARMEAPQDVVRQLFELTPAETSLAMNLMNGLTLQEAAEEMQIRHNTARAHLRSVFSKTGVTRQTELVRLLLNSALSLSTTGGDPPRERSG